MPTRLFFAMERQIARIKAEQGMRDLAITTSAASGEMANSTYQSLIAEQGEVYVITRTRSPVVYAEKGAIDRIKAMLG